MTECGQNDTTAEWDDLFARVGVTLKDAQHFELELRILVTLLCLRDNNSPAIDFDIGFWSLSQKTAGNLIRRLGNEVEVPEHAVRDLMEAMGARNFVVHGFFSKWLPDLHLHGRWEEATEDLRQNAQHIAKAIGLLSRAVVYLAATMGVDLAALQEQTRRQVAEKHRP